ncbi:MAG: YihY family inner membrane protein [Gammaproteobacteria bacterium]|nr:YihY family inner membrane protein [Gammaproteobacteria bacterium]
MKLLRRGAHLARQTSRDFLRDNCPLHAGTLSYITLLSLVPLITIILEIITAFPISHRLSDHVQQFIISNFVPSTSTTMLKYIDRFTDKALALTASGLVFLFIAALFMLHVINKVFNMIWQGPPPRRPAVEWLAYSLILTIGPALVAAPLLTKTGRALGAHPWLMTTLPFVLSYLALTLLYRYVPRVRITTRNAMISGLVALLLLELAKFGFVYYVTRIAPYRTIYGLLASLPALLVWLYLCWAIILFGAELTRNLERKYLG